MRERQAGTPVAVIACNLGCSPPVSLACNKVGAYRRASSRARNPAVPVLALPLPHCHRDDCRRR